MRLPYSTGHLCQSLYVRGKHTWSYVDKRKVFQNALQKGEKIPQNIAVSLWYMNCREKKETGLCTTIYPHQKGGFYGGMWGGGVSECGQTPNNSTGSDNQK